MRIDRLLFIVLLLLHMPLQAMQLHGRAINIDTNLGLTVVTPSGGRHHISLSGIRLPANHSQMQRSLYKRLNGLVAGRYVSFQGQGSRSGGVHLGKLLLGGTDINLLLLEEGLVEFEEMTAISSDKSVYEAAQNRARERQQGLWRSMGH